jgi:hypothetical protein
VASWVVPIALVLVAAVPTAAGFASLPPGTSPHDDITKLAAEQAGFPAGGVKALKAAVRAPDMDEMEFDPRSDKIARVDADGPYRAEHHCDRVPPAKDLEAFNATVAYIRSATAAAVNASRAGDAEVAIQNLGGALHAAQDCSSHSNAVDLGVAGEYPRIVLGNGSAPAGLKLTGFLPGAEDTEMPPGDPYPHGDYNKDSAKSTPEAKLDLPDGRTKFEAARYMAVETSTLILQGFTAQLDGGQMAALGEVEAPKTDAKDKLPIPGVPMPLLVGALGVLMAIRRR